MTERARLLTAPMLLLSLGCHAAAPATRAPAGKRDGVMLPSSRAARTKQHQEPRKPAPATPEARPRDVHEPANARRTELARDSGSERTELRAHACHMASKTPARPALPQLTAERARAKRATAGALAQKRWHGRLPPDQIQRVVRAGYGRYRLCYEAHMRP